MNAYDEVAQLGNMLSNQSVMSTGAIQKTSSLVAVMDNDFEKVSDLKAELDEKLDEVVKQQRAREIKNLHKELKTKKLIGTGSFGKVYKAEWDGNFVAVKIFTTGPSQSSNINAMQKSTNGSTGSNGSQFGYDQNIESFDDERYKEVYSEIVLAANLRPHPNIIRIRGFCRDPLCSVMEFMGGGSVQKLVYGLTNKPEPAADEKFYILVKACSGLRHLTAEGMHHRDIAARNILLSEFGDKIDKSTKVKITDFGMSRKHDEDSGSNQKTVAEGGGSIKWMAPESIQHKVYNEKTDVYMFGSTMWEIMYGREPWEDWDKINVGMNVCFGNKRPEFEWDLPQG